MAEFTRHGTVYPSRAAGAAQRTLRMLGVIGNVVLYAVLLTCVAALIYPPIVGWFR